MTLASELFTCPGHRPSWSINGQREQQGKKPFCCCTTTTTAVHWNAWNAECRRPLFIKCSGLDLCSPVRIRTDWSRSLLDRLLGPVIGLINWFISGILQPCWFTHSQVSEWFSQNGLGKHFFLPGPMFSLSHATKKQTQKVPLA